MSSVVIVGYGSIGQRHADILSSMGHNVGVVSRRPVAHGFSFCDLAESLEKLDPEYVVVANQTNQHVLTLNDLAKLGYRGHVLVEKPIFSVNTSPPAHAFASLRIGYNLRYHPLIRRLRSELEGKQVCSYQAYVGQYLPNWRPNSDYRQSYSAHADQGGGVLLDLSHELDYTLWMLGEWKAVAARGGHVSDLEIDSADCFSLLIETERCQTTLIQMNYLDRRTRREIIVNTTESSFRVDLVSGQFELDSDTAKMPFDRNESFRAMHADILSNGGGDSATVEEALAVLALAEGAEKAAKMDSWVRR